MTVYNEICRSLKVTRSKSETFEHFAARVAKKINSLPDPDWNELTEPLQKWSNSVQMAIEANKALPVLEGWPGEGPAAAEAAPEAEPDEEAASEETTGDDAGEETDETDDADHTEENSDGAEETVDEGDEAEQDNTSATDAPPAKAKKAKAKKTEAKTKSAKSSKATEDQPAEASAKKAEKGKGKSTTKEKDMAKTAKTPKTPKKAAGKGGARISETDTIKVVAKANPYREGTLGAKVFGFYKDGAKIKEIVAKVSKLDTARAPLAILRFDVSKGHIKVVSTAA